MEQRAGGLSSAGLNVAPKLAFVEKQDAAVYLNRLTGLVDLIQEGKLEFKTSSDRDEDFDSLCTEEQPGDLSIKL